MTSAVRLHSVLYCSRYELLKCNLEASKTGHSNSIHQIIVQMQQSVHKVLYHFHHLRMVTIADNAECYNSMVAIADNAEKPKKQ